MKLCVFWVGRPVSPIIGIPISMIIGIVCLATLPITIPLHFILLGFGRKGIFDLSTRCWKVTLARESLARL